MAAADPKANAKKGTFSSNSSRQETPPVGCASEGTGGRGLRVAGFATGLPASGAGAAIALHQGVRPKGQKSSNQSVNGKVTSMGFAINPNAKQPKAKK